MSTDRLYFDVTSLDVEMVETVPIMWEGREMDSGPVRVTLGAPGSHGVIDYTAGTVEVEFRAQIQFPELTEMLADMGADPRLTAPIDTIIRSKGSVFDDHSLRLAGIGTVQSHQLFPSSEMRIEIRAPSQCKPDLVTRSGDEIRAALRAGESVSWNFNPAEKRVDLTLPATLGGKTHVLCIAGSYTLTIAERTAVSS